MGDCKENRMESGAPKVEFSLPLLSGPMSDKECMGEETPIIRTGKIFGGEIEVC